MKRKMHFGNVQCVGCRTVYHESHPRCPWCGDKRRNKPATHNTSHGFPRPYTDLMKKLCQSLTTESHQT